MDCCELPEIFLSFLNDLFFSDISNEFVMLSKQGFLIILLFYFHFLFVKLMRSTLAIITTTTIEIDQRS